MSIIARTTSLFAAIHLASCAAVPDEDLVHSKHSLNSLASIHCEPLANRLEPLPGLNPESIRFLNWNVYKGAKNNWDTDFRNIVGSKDIVVVQEAAMNEKLHSVLDDFGMDWHFTSSFHHYRGMTGVMTAARTAAVHQCGIKAVEPVIRTPKSILLTWYPIDSSDETLLVANIHSVNFSMGLRTFKAQLAAVADMVSMHQGPVIIAGDFNTWSGRRQEALSEMVAYLNMSDVEFEQDSRSRVLGKVVDHIFYKGLNSFGPSIPSLETSDHRPIEVTFALN